MADYATQSKVRGQPGYNALPSPPRRPTAYRREHFHSSLTPHSLRPEPLAGHDCCSNAIKTAIDDVRADWTSRLLADRLFAQFSTEAKRDKVNSGRDATSAKDEESPKPWDVDEILRLRPVQKTARPLFTLGCRGNADDAVLYPRAIAVDAESGDLYVADTGNRRIQRYTKVGVYLGTISTPSDGSGESYFQEPTGVAVPAFGSTVVVADRSLKQILVFTKGPSADHRLVTSFTTLGQPYCVTCDSQNHIIVSTTSGRLEVYDAAEPNFAAAETLARTVEDGQSETTESSERRPDCRLITAFAVRGQQSSSRHPSALFVASSSARPDAVVVSDPLTSTVTWYALDGRPLFEFRPSYSKTAIAGAFSDSYQLSFAPAGIDVDAAGQLFIVDRLNGAVCVFNDRGTITKQLIQSSSAGAVQAVAVTPEGHLVCTEYHDGMTNASHCVRVYGYRQCSCHSVKQQRH